MTKGNTKADTRALYRKYRSKSLTEVVGQSHITDILSRALQQGKIGHAYLFTGPRGVGKTSVARILAHEINGLPYDESTQHPDIIEIDAASNRRIDDIRELRDKVAIAPAAAAYKVYIIDEVHMLTGESFNAFLKTLEEPPEHVVFILATTDAHKLPVTITSRTQQFAFRSIAPADAERHLRDIADQESIAVDDDALAMIAQHGDGSFRDSISLLDQLSSFADEKTPITLELVERVLGIAKHEQIAALLAAYQAGDHRTIISIVDELEQRGIATTAITAQLVRQVREQLSDAPQLRELLDGLVSVIGSPRPDIKLLTVLLSRAPSTFQKNAAAVVTAPRELQPLEKEASQSQPNETNVRKEAAKQVSPPKESQPKASKPKKTKARSDVSFDWDAYVSSFKEDHMALATVLAKCKAEYDGSQVTIYAGTAFWKKKLDTTKYQPLLHDGLAAMGMNDVAIEILPTAMPPKDSQAAAVAAIMGGGEEVAL